MKLLHAQSLIVCEGDKHLLPSKHIVYLVVLLRLLCGVIAQEGEICCASQRFFLVCQSVTVMDVF